MIHTSFFTYRAAPYADKPENSDGPYHTCATGDYVKYLVNEVRKMQNSKDVIYQLIVYILALT